MGLMIAVGGGALPDLAGRYFALSQLSICLLPFPVERFAPRGVRGIASSA